MKMSIERLLKIRREIKRRKLYFVRRDYYRLSRLSDSWRRPKNRKSRVRRKEKGVVRMPSVGWKSPRKVRGLHPCGKKEAIVHNVKELENYDPKEYVIRIAASVGRRKRIEIVKRAKELGFRVLNANARGVRV